MNVKERCGSGCEPVILFGEAEAVEFHNTLIKVPHAEDAVFNRSFLKDWAQRSYLPSCHYHSIPPIIPVNETSM